MLEHTIIQYFLSSFLWTFCKPLLFTVTVNFLQTQDFKKEQKQKNSFAFHSQVWATRSHSWKKSWGSRCLKKTEEIQPWHDSEKNFSPVRNTRCLLWMKESQHSTEMHGAKVWSASGCSGLLESNTFPVWLHENMILYSALSHLKNTNLQRFRYRSRIWSWSHRSLIHCLLRTAWILLRPFLIRRSSLKRAPVSEMSLTRCLPGQAPLLK